VDAALQQFGQIDVLVNNAGRGLVGAVEEVTADEVRSAFAVNVEGTLNVSRAAPPSMRARKSGHILNLSSVGGFVSWPGWGIYCATNSWSKASARRCTQNSSLLASRSQSWSLARSVRTSLTTRRWGGRRS
jgi:NADP-dependent 3-hydroxy acid dehydrogenase YdfG